MYSFDTSAFMDWQARYYPPDIFISLVTRIEELIAAGQCCAVELVKEEIDAVGTPELRAWVKKHPALFLTLDPLVQVEAASIESRYPDLLDSKSPHQSAHTGKLGGRLLILNKRARRGQSMERN